MRARRVDLNHRDILEEAQYYGFDSLDLSTLGHGDPDALLSDASDMWLVEFKSEHGKLSQRQIDRHQRWRGKPILVVRSFQEFMEKIKKG